LYFGGSQHAIQILNGAQRINVGSNRTVGTSKD